MWCALLVCNSAGLLLPSLHTARVPARASSPCLFGGGGASKPSKASRQKAAKPSTKRPVVAAGKSKKPWEAGEKDIKQRKAILKVFKQGAVVARLRKAEREEAEEAAPTAAQLPFSFGGRAQPPASPPATEQREAQAGNQRKLQLLAEKNKLEAEVGAAGVAASGGFDLGEFASMCAELVAAKAQLAVQQQVDGVALAAAEAWAGTKAAPERAKQSLLRSANEAAEAIAAAPVAAAAAATAEVGKAQSKLAASINEAVESVIAAPGKTQAKLTASIEAVANEIQELPNKVTGSVKGQFEAAQGKADAQLEKAKSSIPRRP